MGVLNVTPAALANNDRRPDHAAALSRGRRLIAEGADIVEVSGMPRCLGAAPVGHATETALVVDVVEALAGDVRVSIATGSDEVAAAAVAAGATLVTDVSPISTPSWESLYHVAADADVGWVGAYVPCPSATGRRIEGATRRPDIVAEVAEALEDRAELAAEAGVAEIYIDPGIGFGLGAGPDLELLGNLGRLAEIPRALVVGTGDVRLIDEPDESREGSVESDGRGGLEESLTVAVWAMLAGAVVLRTHHVAATVEAARTVGTKPPVGAPAGPTVKVLP